MINATSRPVEKISVFCGTWNMGGRSPPGPREMRSWIPAEKHDLYVISVQECSYSKSTDQFFKVVEQAVSNGKYVTLASEILWDIRIIVLAKKKHIVKVTNVEGGNKPTGFMNVCGNKGGLGTQHLSLVVQN